MVMRIVRPILLAEDNARDAELTLAALESHHLANRVVVVRDGQELLDYLRCREKYAGREPVMPAVVMLDLKMPRIGGLEALAVIRKDPLLKDLPVVILTSSREEKDLVESYRLGVNAYVVKPVHFEEFFEAVRTLGVFWAVLNEPPPPNGSPA
jgi:CheY-like chemotaxis protein